MANCTYLIEKGFEFDCDNPIVSGLENDAWLINRKFLTVDYENVGTSANPVYDKHVIVNVGTTAGDDDTTAVKIKQIGDAYSGTATSLNEGTFLNTFTHTVNILIPKNDPVSAKEILFQLANGEFVVIVKNKYHSEDEANRFQIYGLERGLKAASIDEDKYSEETNSGWAVSLTEAGNPYSAQFAWIPEEIGGDATEESTEEALDSLLD